MGGAGFGASDGSRLERNNAIRTSLCIPRVAAMQCVPCPCMLAPILSYAQANKKYISSLEPAVLD